MTVRLTGRRSHPRKLFSTDVWTCVSAIVKIRFRYFRFISIGYLPYSSAVLNISNKRSERSGAVKVDRQMPGALESSSTTLGSRKSRVWWKVYASHQEHFAAGVSHKPYDILDAISREALAQ